MDLRRLMVVRAVLVSMIGFIALLAPVSSARGDNRTILLGQDAWEQHRGFYLDLENPGPGGAAGNGPLPLSGLTLALGVGDGKAWQFVTAGGPWTLGQRYHVTAVLAGARATLRVDGREVGHADGAMLVPAAVDITAQETPTWASAAADYQVIEQSIAVTSNQRVVLQHAWPDDAASASAGQRLFAPPPPWRDSHWHPQPGEPLRIDVEFTLQVQTSDLRTLAPFVDRYGQDRFGQWAGKVTDDAQLTSDAADEQQRLATMPPGGNVDIYGGDKQAGWQAHPTGYYRLTQRGGFWFLITPSGLPCFYTGVCTAPLLTGNGTPVTQREYLFADLPDKTGPLAAAWSAGVWGEPDNQYVAFDTANMIRKYGPDRWREKGQSLCSQRLRAWGFAGLGKWAEPFGGLPYLAVLFHSQDPKSGHGKLDVFDPAARDRFRAGVESQMQPRRKDPFLVGWSVGNEMDEIVRNDDLAAMLQAPSATPAKRAIVAAAIDTIYHHSPPRFASAWRVHGTSLEEWAAQPLTAPPADIEPLRQFFARAYYRFIYQTVKSLDPDHLYLGFWIVPDWWQNDSDWGLIAPYCDVIGYDRYADTFSDAHVDRLMQQTAKPVLCGEFSFPPTYAGQRGFGAYFAATTPDDAASGQRYQQWMHDAALNRYCVGGTWFEYRDEPITGRGPGMGPALVYDEHYAFGVLDVTDRPKWDLVGRMREANLKVTRDRLQASDAVQP